MLVESATKSTLTLLSETLDKIGTLDYSKPCEELSGASIGQHYRHILEMFECLIQGYDIGTVSYDDRKRDLRLEQDKRVALRFIHNISSKISMPEKALRLGVGYDEDTDEAEYFDTTYHRELAYTLEHAVHHMAILKIGLRFIAPSIILPENFGVAASTLRHKKANG
jgi:hypothetical protein